MKLRLFITGLTKDRTVYTRNFRIFESYFKLYV